MVGEKSPARKHGAVCADRLAEKRTACASVDLIDSLNLPPITRETPLRQSANRKSTAVGISWPLILELRV